MKKTLKDFTPEIQERIPEYIARYTKGVFDGGRYNSFSKKDAEDLINWNYNKCKLKNPVVLVAENPYESQIFFNYIKANEKIYLPILYTIYCLKNGIEFPFKELPNVKIENIYSQLHSQLDSQLHSQLNSKLHSQLHSQLNSQLRSQLHSQLDSQLDSQLHSQLNSQLHSQLHSQLDSQLHSQLYSKLHSQLDSQLHSQLNSQLRSQLDSQLNSQLHSQLNSQLYSQLDSQLYSQLNSQLDSQLYSQLDSQLNSQLDSQLHSQLNSQLYSQLDSQLYSHLNSQLDSQLDSKLRSQLHSQLYSQLHSQLNSQLYSQLNSQLGKYNEDYLFTSNIYSGTYGAWFKFIKDEFNIECEIGAELDLWNNLYQKSGVYSAIFSELLCVVSKYPMKVYRNANNDLHSTNECAVKWGYSTEMTKFDCHYVNGRNISSKLFNEVVSGSITFSDFKKIENEDEKGVIMTIIKENNGNEGLLKFLGAVEVDKKKIKHTESYSETIRLLKTKERYSFLQNSKGEENQPYAWIEMICPSTGTTYLIDTCPSFTDALECAKWHRPKNVPSSVEYLWQSAN